MVDAHSQAVSHRYIVHYPQHPARKDDPHYVDFEEYRKRTKATARCAVGAHRDDFSECGGELELHHAHVEFSLQNGIDLKWLEKDYPGISDRYHVGAWVESAPNLEWLCEFHHRGAGGVHVASASDFEAEKYVRGLISGEAKDTARSDGSEVAGRQDAGQAQPASPSAAPARLQRPAARRPSLRPGA